MIAVDTDVLLASMASEGTVRRLLIAADADLVTLDGAFDVLRRHLPLVAMRTRTPREGLATVLDRLGTYVDEADFADYEATYTGLEMSYPWARVREIDLLALAKALDARIWTHNEAFDQADDLEVLSTDDVFAEVAR